MPSKARKARLAEARVWYRQQNFTEDSHVVKAYRKRFNVDRICAMKELVMLGVLSPQKQKTYKTYLENRRLRKSRRKKQPSIEIESDETFAYIVGYTSGGAPFGITWEEDELLKEEEQSDQKTHKEKMKIMDSEDLPF
ncbi:MAG: hypothetical protein IJ225_08070 [Solobacterium sp.]|nr:hypothetical protein [Solobacterium sp.]